MSNTNDININARQLKMESMKRYRNHEEVKRKWVQINKSLNTGQSASIYSSIVMEALTLTDIVIEIILEEKLRKEEYERTNMFQQLQLLKQLNYPLSDAEISELTNIKRVRNIGAHNTESIISEQISYEDTIFSMEKIGHLLHKIGFLGKEDIKPSTDLLSAKIGDVIGGIYQLMGVIGQGGSSVVYSAKHKRLDTVVAVKEIHHDMLQYIDVSKEKSYLLSLSHKGIPRILDVVHDNQTYYIVMEFIEGKTLDQEVEKVGYLSETEALDIIIQTADILRYLHNEKNIIFQDLKPQNLMIDHQRKVHLIDFGYSKNIGDHDEGTYSGTPLFSSPEQVEGIQTDRRSDIYSLGAVLYYLVEGAPPKPNQERSYRRSVRAEMINLIEHALKSDRNQRFQTIDEFVMSAKAALLLKNRTNESVHEAERETNGASKRTPSKMIIVGAMVLALSLFLIMPKLMPVIRSMGEVINPISGNETGTDTNTPEPTETDNSGEHGDMMKVLEDFKQLYLKMDSQGLVELMHEDAFRYTDMSPNEYDDALYSYFSRNPAGFEFIRTSEVRRLSDDLYIADVTFRNGAGTFDEPLTFKKSGSDWKIMTGGMIDEVYRAPENIQSPPGEITFILDRVILTTKGAILKVRVDNLSPYDYTLGWVNKPRLNIKTDTQTYTAEVDIALNDKAVLKDTSKVIGLEVKGLEAIPESMEIHNIQRLLNSLPDLNAEIEVMTVNIP